MTCINFGTNIKHFGTIIGTKRLIVIQGTSRFDNSVNIGAKQWPTRRIYWLPNHQNILKKATCSKNESCLYQSTESANLKIHEENCKVNTQVKSKQRSFGKPFNMLENLIENEILSEEMRNFSFDHFCCYDIETCQTLVDGEQKLIPISIAVSSTFTEDRYFERASSSPEDGDKMIFNFMDYLSVLSDLYRSL